MKDIPVLINHDFAREVGYITLDDHILEQAKNVIFSVQLGYTQHEILEFSLCNRPAVPFRESQEKTVMQCFSDLIKAIKRLWK